jgi:hypothetical protein
MIEPNEVATVPSTPNPAILTLVEDLVRSVLLLLAGFGVYHGTTSDSLVFLVSSAVVAIGTALWGIYQKIHAKQVDHAGNVLSARLQKPVQPVSVP